MDSTFYILIKIVVAGLAGLCLFLCASKKSILPLKSFFTHYAFGFALLALQQIIPLFMLSCNNVCYPLYSLLVLSYFFIASLAYVLFLRGTLSLFTKNRFLTTVFPFSFLFVCLIFSSIAVYLCELKVLTVATIFMWSFPIQIAAFLGTFFLYSFVKNFKFKNFKYNLPNLFLSLSWYYSMIICFRFWVNVISLKGHDFWVISSLSSTSGHWLRIAFYFLLFVGSILYFHANKKTKALEE